MMGIIGANMWFAGTVILATSPASIPRGRCSYIVYKSLGFRVEDLGFRVCGLGFRMGV